MTCRKQEHGSQHLAENAVVLHGLSFPECPGTMQAYPCGDHWHIGHLQQGAGVECKARHADYHRGRPRERATLQQ